MSTASVSIDRTALSLAPLVVSSDGSTYRITDTGLGEPAMSWRMTYMPDSPDVHGSEPVSAALEQTSLPLEVMMTGATWADVAAARAALTDALSQFSYTVTVTVDGVARAWRCAPASWSPSGGQVLAELVAGRIEKVSVTIPVYPIAGTA